MLCSYLSAMAVWSYIIIVLYHWLTTWLLMVLSSVHTAQYSTTRTVISSDHRTYDVSLKCRRDPRVVHVRPHFSPDQHHLHVSNKIKRNLLALIEANQKMLSCLEHIINDVVLFSRLQESGWDVSKGSWSRTSCVPETDFSQYPKTWHLMWT